MAEITSLSPPPPPPPFLSVAYHERVSNAQRAAWENSVRTYSPTFTGMWELDDNQVRVSAGTRSEYWAAKFHSPLSDTSLYVYGFDAMSSPVRRAAVEKAIDTGSLAVTPAIMSSVTLESSRVGLYSAVYSTSTVPSTVAARRAAAVGAVLSFITVSNIMDTSSLGISSHIRFYLIDSSVSSGGPYLFMRFRFLSSPVV